MKFLVELKNRLIFILVSILFTAFAAAVYKEFLIYSIAIPIITIYQKDISNIYFIYTNLTDIFDVYIKVFLFVIFQSYIMVSSYQIFKFLTPALYKHEYQTFKNILFINSLFLIQTHFLLCQYLIPLTLIFFNKLQYSLKIKSGLIFYFENKINEYVDFYLVSYFAIYSICMLFLVFSLYLFHKNKKKIYIKNHRKTIYVMSYILAAFLTPPDIINQVILFTMIIIIFEIMVLGFVFYDRLNLEAN